MFRAIAQFELKYHLTSPLFPVFVIALSLMTFAFSAGDAADAFGAVNDVKQNSPYVVMQCLLMMSLFGTLTTTAFVVNSVNRDFELNTDAMFFSRPITKLQYLAGRFTGSFVASLFIFFGVLATMMGGGLAPWIPKENLGPILLYPYVYSFFFLILPNLLLIGAILFAVAALTRSLMASYTTVVVLAVFYGVAQSLAEDTEKEALSGLLDPFGVRALFHATRYWTVFQKNNDVVPLEGIFLWNRLLWLALAVVILLIAYYAFDFTTGSRKSRRKAARSEVETRAAAERTAVIRVPQVFGARASLGQFGAIVRMEAINTFKSLPYLIILLCAVASIGGELVGESWLGKPYPLTREMINSIREGFTLFTLLIAAFYAGDIVWRERALKLSEVSDAMPVATSIQWLAKLTSLIAVVMSTLAAGVLTTILVQTLQGWHEYEFGLYARAIFGLLGVRLALVAGLAFIMQVFFNHKLAGIIGISIWFVLHNLLPEFGIEHPLYRFAGIPVCYSDMNGYGHYVQPILWQTLYWVSFVVLLLTVGHLIWVRGTEGNLAQRLRSARVRFGRGVATATVLSLCAFVSTGCYIYYNTNVLNPYRSSEDNEARAARREKLYKKYENWPEPRIVAAQANVDIHPDRRAVYITGRYTAVNAAKVPIQEVHVAWSPVSLTKMDVVIPGAKLTSDDRELGFQTYKLDKPLAPGATMTITFNTAYEAKGFAASGVNNRVVENGTFIHTPDYFPSFGYTGRGELQDNRAAYGLPPLERMKAATDLKAREENAFGRSTDWMEMETTVSTSSDQIAIAPGELQKEWTANGRRYFHYKSRGRMMGFWPYMSARYQVKRDKWNDVDIEVYYDEKHPYNVDRMVYAVKKSLDYYTKNLSPYQHKVVRILEFPAYAKFAQSFAGMIPYSEDLGFTADQRDPDALDYVFLVTAHEVAHQWWGHQVVGANVQGSAVLSESLASFCALMVLDKEVGDHEMRRYLRDQLNRYLAGRGKEIIREMPLMLVERQDYIHYNKGALAFFALREAIGEDRVNRALSKFIKDRAFQGPPYPTTMELVQYLRAEAPADAQQLITELFERIVLYDNQAREASVTKRADGKYVVKLTVASTKLTTDGKSEEKPIPNNDAIEIGVFGENDKQLYLQKLRITKPVQTFEIVVGEKPVRAGIDPFSKLIDRHPNDNVKSL